jgi:hypothetical protein
MLHLLKNLTNLVVDPEKNLSGPEKCCYKIDASIVDSSSLQKINLKEILKRI